MPCHPDRVRESYRPTAVPFDNTPYVTVNAAVRSGYCNVVIMHYDYAAQQHFVFRISEAMPKKDAAALCKSWAAASQLEVR